MFLEVVSFTIAPYFSILPVWCKIRATRLKLCAVLTNMSRYLLTAAHIHTITFSLSLHLYYSFRLRYKMHHFTSFHFILKAQVGTEGTLTTALLCWCVNFRLLKFWVLCKTFELWKQPCEKSVTLWFGRVKLKRKNLKNNTFCSRQSVWC